MKIVGEIIKKGNVSGSALVSSEPISFLGGVDPKSGKIIEKGHEKKGANITDKILIFPHCKGSTVGSYVMHELKLNENHPKGIIVRKAEAIVFVGAIISEIPLLHNYNKDPVKIIEDGDHVKIEKNTVLVKKNG